MKKLRRKNQLILTLLAVMIAVAGYLTYLPQEKETVPALGEQGGSALMDISDEDVLAENIALEQAQFTGVSGTGQNNGETGEAAGNLQESGAAEGEKVSGNAAASESASESMETDESAQSSSAQPGEAVLTWAEQVENVMAEAELSREQVRTRNEETLNNIINNENLSQEQRKTAANNLMTMTENASTEASIESILQTKGLARTLVTINESGVEVLVGSTSITNAERAQIEDTVKREADVEISDIVISLMNQVNTEVVEEP